MQCVCSDEIKDNKIFWSRKTQDIRNVNTFYRGKKVEASLSSDHWRRGVDNLRWETHG